MPTSSPRASKVNASDPLGDMLRRARHNQDVPLTQEDVANALGVVQSTISAWESGRARPSLPDIQRLSGVLKLDVSKMVAAAASNTNGH